MCGENIYIIVGCIAKHCGSNLYSNVTLYASDNFFTAEEDAISQLKREMYKNLADARDAHGNQNEADYDLFAMGENNDYLTWGEDCWIKSGKIDDVPIMLDINSCAKWVRFGYRRKEEMCGTLYTYYVCKCSEVNKVIQGINS